MNSICSFAGRRQEHNVAVTVLRAENHIWMLRNVPLLCCNNTAETHFPNIYLWLSTLLRSSAWTALVLSLLGNDNERQEHNVANTVLCAENHRWMLWGMPLMCCNNTAETHPHDFHLWLSTLRSFAGRWRWQFFARRTTDECCGMCHCYAITARQRHTFVIFISGSLC